MFEKTGHTDNITLTHWDRSEKLIIRIRDLYLDVKTIISLNFPVNRVGAWEKIIRMKKRGIDSCEKSVPVASDTKNINPGVGHELPDVLKTLIEMNHPFVNNVPKYFGSDYPVQWFKKCTKTQQKNSVINLYETRQSEKQTP